MVSYSVVFFSLLLISSIIIVSNFESSFSEEVIATSIGFEDSSILELKNSRGNTIDINTVRIWLSGDNEFKSFKTEQGWIGKNTLQGVIIFTSQNEIKPGETVKFGIKTIKQDPTINWKAIDTNGEVITSGSTKILSSKTDNDESQLNKPEIIGITSESGFRFIPEQPTSNSDFRIVGEKFVPGQTLDFYIENNFKDSIKVDKDGKILFTSKTPKILDGSERTEFILRDSGGNEKVISIRVIESDKRETSESIKLSIDNTPKNVKRGEVVILNGMGTPDSTLTITLKHSDGNIININTIQVKNNGEWNFDSLFSPDLDLGKIGIQIDDGTNRMLREFNVISAASINVFTKETMYEPGDAIEFSGKALPDQEMSVSLVDEVGKEVFSRSMTVGDTGVVDFEIEISRDSIEGTYILYLFQGNEEGITVFGVGQEPKAILIVKPTKLNFELNEDVRILIHGIPNTQISLILIDSSTREIFSDSINLGPDGMEIYEIDSEELNNGSYTLTAKRGESTGEGIFTVGFTTGSGKITVQTTRSDYLQGEQILILGSTASNNVLLELKITSPDGDLVKRIETFSDQNGFKIDNFRIPVDGEIGIWTISAKSGGNFSETEFEVKGNDEMLILLLDKNTYKPDEIVNINGSGAKSASISLKIFDSDGEKVTELNITATSNGKYSTFWQIPTDMLTGEYEFIADDGINNASMKFTVN